MTTSEIFTPFILNALFAVVGCFATLGAMAVKELSITDADLPNSRFQRSPSETGRHNFLLLFCLPPFIVGAIWGLVYAALFTAINEALSYAIAMILGIVSNSFVLKLNGLSIQEVINLIKNNFPGNDT